MKRHIISSLFVCVALSLGLALGQAQDSRMPSLGDLARQLKAQRAREASQKPKVYTNDDLPARPRGEGLTTASGMSATTGSQKEAKPKETSTPGAEAGSSEATHGEKYFRARMSELRAQLELHQRELSVLQQKDGQAEMQYYPDPNKTLQQGSTPAFNSDLNKLRAQIDEKKQQVAADEKTIDDLRDELRRQGGDPGWLR